MPISASARKAQRVSLRKKEINKPIRSQLRSDEKKAKDAILRGDANSAEAAVRQAAKSLDKAAKKGLIHSKNAANHKSRLMKGLNRMKASAPAIKEPVTVDTADAE